MFFSIDSFTVVQFPQCLRFCCFKLHYLGLGVTPNRMVYGFKHQQTVIKVLAGPIHFCKTNNFL